MIRRRITLTGQTNGLPLSIIIGFVPLMQPFVLRCTIGIPKLCVQQLQVIVGRHVFGINFECPFESGDRRLPVRLCLFRLSLTSSYAAEVKIGLAQQIDHRNIQTKVKLTFLQLRPAILQDTGQIASRILQTPLLSIEDATEPRPGPARIAHL